MREAAIARFNGDDLDGRNLFGIAA